MFPEVELTSVNEHHLSPGDVLLSWNVTGLDGTPCIVGSTSSATKFTISGIDGSRVDLTVTAGITKLVKLYRNSLRQSKEFFKKSFVTAK